MDVVCAVVRNVLVAIARRDDDALRSRPVLIGRSSETQGVVIACSDEAARAGVARGMPLTRALVLCPSAAVVALREEQVEAATHGFLQTIAERLPAAEGIEPGHVHGEVRGLARLARLSPAAYLAELQESLAGRTGLPVRVGAAGTVFAAHAAAAYLAKPTRLLDESDARDLLGGLPVEALPVSEGMLRKLHLFGLERLEQVGALPPTALQAQFGREGLRAWRLIHGEERGRITPAREDVRVVERMELPAAAVVSTPLLLATEILLRRAMRRQGVEGRSLRRADWVVEMENGERESLRFVFREATADQKRMLFVLRTGIERLVLPAPATAVELTLSGICSEYVRQERLWNSGPRAAAALAEAIEQLSVREGSPQIYRVVEVEPWSRIPERQRALLAL
jgi:DNA polymerase-4/protein ImuB